MSTISHDGSRSPGELTTGWRREQLEAAGYPTREAREMSGRLDIDLHLAIRLLRQGCPVETALRILL
jgi:hypothetical protein